MVDMNILGRLDEEALTNIDEALKSFEKENYCKLASKGKMLIKSEYMRRKKLWKNFVLYFYVYLYYILYIHGEKQNNWQR